MNPYQPPAHKAVYTVKDSCTDFVLLFKAEPLKLSIIIGVMLVVATLIEIYIIFPWADWSLSIMRRIIPGFPL